MNVWNNQKETKQKKIMETNEEEKEEENGRKQPNK